ncbi:MAG TPA: DUF2306 domain-containing protein [Chloroflexota bacterium]|nr:DUF2306 domain-containing protein [Chloroflexota bacterium]
MGLAGGPELMPANAHFAASPLPVVLHIVSVSIFAILGAFQFSTGFRRRRPGWHRTAGRLVVASGLLVGLSGLWLTLFYSHPDGSQPLLFALRLLFGSAMVVSIVLGLAAILRRNVQRHRAWMMRGYAIGLGAGTQVLTLSFGDMILGPPTEFSRALLMGAAWVINLAVAEWVIRKRTAPPARTTGKRPLHRGGALDELVGGAETTDPRIHAHPFKRNGRTFLPLTRGSGAVHRISRSASPGSKLTSSPGVPLRGSSTLCRRNSCTCHG